MAKSLPKKIKVSMPGVEDFELEYADGGKLKRAICEHLGIEEKFTNLIIKSGGRKVIVDYLWARQQIQLGAEGQRKLRQAKVAVVGVGALGNDLVRNLVLMGIGNITLIDFDKVEVSNLNRTMYSNEDVGKNKAKALAEIMSKHYPYANLKAIPRRVERINPKILADTDVIISGLDSMLVRIWLTDFAIGNRIPLIDGGLKGLQARVQVWIPEYPCLACEIPAENYAEVMDLHNSCENVLDTKIAAFPTISALTASVQANEAMKIILGKKPMKGILIVDLMAGRYTLLPLDRNPNCMVCKGK